MDPPRIPKIFPARKKKKKPLVDSKHANTQEGVASLTVFWHGRSSSLFLSILGTHSWCSGGRVRQDPVSFGASVRGGGGSSNQSLHKMADRVCEWAGGCKKQAHFGDAEGGLPKFCNSHKEEQHRDVRKKT